MRFRDRILYSLVKNTLVKNRKFKDVHKGEYCYIFGNGVSLKSMDLQTFGDKVSIGCNSLFVHKDFDKLDCRYYQLPASILFYPYRRYYGTLQRNYVGDLFRNKIRQYNGVHFFTSVTNCLNMRGRNISYTYHFGSIAPDVNQCNMDGVFSFMSGGLMAMLGTAIYMGFEKAVLVGCDYTFSPKMNRHFFEKGKGISEQAENMYEEAKLATMFDECRKEIELQTITPDGTISKVLDFSTYSEYTKSSCQYHENMEIVDELSLRYLNKQGNYVIY